MVKEKDITGKRFNHLTALKKINRKWLFKCDCGSLKEIDKYSVLKGEVKSCGCLLKSTRAIYKTKHGLSKSKLYKCWLGIKKRCFNKNATGYKNYGGRGIKVCDDWKNNFMSFYEWAIKNGYREDLTIERIDIDRDYFPENCKWISSKEQAQNRRSSVFIEYNGEKHCLNEWARKMGKEKFMWYSTKFKHIPKIEILKMWDKEKHDKLC